MSNRVVSLPLNRFDHHVENGRCRNFDRCRKRIKSPHRYYCSEECALYLFKISNWSAIRISVMERDNYRCVKCGIDAVHRAIEVDHIVPVALGGDPLDPGNCQTLCYICHQEKTKKDKKKIREKRIQEMNRKIEKIRAERRKMWGHWGLKFSRLPH